MATNSAGIIDIETILRSYGKTMDRKIWKLNNMSSLNINHMLSEVDITSYGRAYILFTRPDLNLFSDNRTTINQDIIDYAPVLHSSIMRNPAMAYMLQSSTRIGGISSTGTANGFMNILNNQCVSCNVPGMKLSLRAASKNSKQYGVSYGGELYEALGETDILAGIVTGKQIGRAHV